MQPGVGAVRARRYRTFEYPLFRYAAFDNFDGVLAELASVAMPENWNYTTAADTTCHVCEGSGTVTLLTGSREGCRRCGGTGKTSQTLPVLRSYVHYTFKQIKREKKITETASAACFNTGLVTENQEEIFMLFRKGKAASPAWDFSRLCRESDRELLRFQKLPDIANYFHDPRDLLFDTRLEIRMNVEHIIEDNRARFPAPYSTDDSNLKHQLRILLEGALGHAVKRVRRNYKTAIPQFYKNKLQLLLPLCLTNKSKADLALVVARQNNVYLASTCLPLDWAYNNARLIARPDNEWLNP